MLKRPENRMGLLFGIVGIVWGLDGFGREYAEYAYVTEPGAPGGAIGAWAGDWLWVPSIGLITTFSFLLFPNGHSLGGRWRFLGWLSLAALVLAGLGAALGPGELEDFNAASVENPFGLRPAVITEILIFIGVPALGIASLGSAASMVVRFRRAEGIERLQLKWFALAAALVAVSFLVTIACYAISAEAGETASIGTIVALFSLPVAAGIAILRFRLYDIDLLINRTLVYVPLTGLLAGLYVAITGLLRTVFTELTDTASDAAIAMSTLLVVALLTPLKNQLQSFVDKRFKEAHDPMKDLKRYTDQLESVVHVLDAKENAARLLENAMAALNAEGGAVYLGRDGTSAQVVRSGRIDLPMPVRLPLIAEIGEIGYLALAARADGSTYSAEELKLVQAAADLAARAIALSPRPAATEAGRS
jgi:hypothetical protein